MQVTDTDTVMAAKSSLLAALIAAASLSANAQSSESAASDSAPPSTGVSPGGDGYADGRFTAGVQLTTTLSDNIDLDNDDQQSGYTLEVGPYFRYGVDRPRLQADIYYGLRYFDTSGDLGNDGLRHDLRSRFNTALWEDNFWLSGKAVVGEVVNNPVSDSSVDPSRQEGDRTTVQRYSIAPYFTGNLRDRDTSYVAGYGASFNKNSDRAEAQLTQKIIGNITRDTRQRGLGWLMESEFSTSGFESSDAKYDTSNFIAEGLIRPNGQFRAGLGAQYTKISVLRDDEGKNSGWAPTASALWTPNRRTTFSARYSRPYYGSASTASLTHQTDHWILALQYDYGLTDSSSGPLGATDIQSTFADGRRSGGHESIVNSLMQDEVMPEFGTFVTDGFISGALGRTRRLNLTAGWSGRRTSLGVLLARVHSESVSTDIALPVLQGAPQGLQQTTLAITGNRQLDRRTNALARISTTISESNDLATKSRLDVFTLSWQRSLNQKTDFAAAYRFANQSIRFGQGNKYREHAIVLSVNYRF